MAMVRKKQDDKYLEALRELITTGGGNRQCFDCGQKGPTYVNMTIGSFVCTRCSGVLRGITPPHRVKSISMATFTQEEIDFLKAHGNDVCAKTWLGLWDPKRAVHQDQRELMIDKYERKRYYLEPASPLKSLTNATNLKSSATTATSSATSNASNSRSSNNSSSNNNTQIQLTPPTSQRTTANGLHKSSSSAISRPHHSTPPQNGFGVHSSTHTDAFGLHNGLNGLNGLNTSVGSASTGALSDTSSCASANGFGAEADFVADFGSADIFNATVASSPASSIGSVSTNGYAKIQPLKAAHHQQFTMNNGHHGNSFGSSPATNGNTENFADFDHAPIYNSADEINYQFVRKNAIRKKSLRSNSLSLKPNERQLKDILEMENPMTDEFSDGLQQQQQQPDYMQFPVVPEVNGRSRDSQSDFTDILEDFEKFLTLKQNEARQFQQQQHQLQSTGSTATNKFTPLALAAHATAMAVLGNANHFNSQSLADQFNDNSIGSQRPAVNTQWDVWSTDTATSATTRPMETTAATTAYWTASDTQQQLQVYGQSANYLSGCLDLDYQQPFQPSLANTYSSHNTTTNVSNNSSNATISNAFPDVASASVYDNASTGATSGGKTITTRRSSTDTNPFRNAHLDVNDNFATNSFNRNHNYNNLADNYNSNYTANDNYMVQNYNNNNIIDLNANAKYNNFEYVTNFNFNSNSNFNSDCDNSNANASFSPLSNYDFRCDRLSPQANNFANFNNNNQTNYNNGNHSNNSNNNNNNINYYDSHSQYEHNVKHNAVHLASPNNPFIQDSEGIAASASLSSGNEAMSARHQAFGGDDMSGSKLHSSAPPPPSRVVADANANFNVNPMLDNGAPIARVAALNASGRHSFVASNATPSTMAAGATTENSRGARHSYCCNANDNDIYSNNNNNNSNNSWRLPIPHKNGTTNGYNGNNNNNSAPAEDRYAALKDLDEQLRESKAVAAQAASIVTANVVESGFGNPTSGSTVNPFAAAQAAIANPFQNGNSPQPTPQNTTQLFGQMTLIPNGIATANGFLNAQKAQSNAGFFNYTANGFTTSAGQNGNAMYPAAAMPGAGPNGCGFGYGPMQQQITATGQANTFNNPFAASGALNSNNPFL